ncbi:MAG: carboxypeptidase regulatory-like domain-containing protein, partial [Armatimonadota bacterium]|nr:carboxypeptidase regulatory-like domain-containing protein [Armatimonadota bacterium]
LLAGPFATYESVPTMSWISNPTYGMLKGKVKDASGKPIYPATVTIQSKSTKNSGTGFYGFVDLSTGTYTVTASANGYNSASANVTIVAGQVKTVDFTLTPSGGANEIIIDNSDSGFSCSSNWSTGTSATDKYGTNYRYRNTQATSDPATWTPNIPTSGTWAVYAWWSQGTNRSSSAPYIVYYSGGSTTIYKNQQSSGGQWNLLTTQTFGTGTGYPTLLSCWTTTGYVVIADAVKWVKQ